MAKRKWTGTLTQDLMSAGHSLSNLGPDFVKGQKVVVWKKRRYETDLNDRSYWDGKYQYHYSDENGRGLVRTSKFLLEEYNEPNLD